MSFLTLFFLIFAILLLSITIIKTLCNSRNKYPKFHNGDKRLSEILYNVDKQKYKTRKII